jgi:hypothetical protein
VDYYQVSGVEIQALTTLEKSADKAASTSSQRPDDSKELVSEW